MGGCLLCFNNSYVLIEFDPILTLFISVYKKAVMYFFENNCHYSV